MADPSASTTPVAIPTTLWESDGTEEAVLAEWYVEDGTRVEAGTLLAEIMVDKVTMEIDAPASGVLEIRIPAEAPVGLGMTLAVIHSP